MEKDEKPPQVEIEPEDRSIGSGWILAIVPSILPLALFALCLAIKGEKGSCYLLLWTAPLWVLLVSFGTLGFRAACSNPPPETLIESRICPNYGYDLRGTPAAAAPECFTTNPIRRLAPTNIRWTRQCIKAC